jgi:hypothetical protein
MIFSLSLIIIICDLFYSSLSKMLEIIYFYTSSCENECVSVKDDKWIDEEAKREKKRKAADDETFTGPEYCVEL